METLRGRETEIRGRELLEWLKNNVGVDFVTGLPCGELRSFIEGCFFDGEINYTQTTNEREAVGISAGAWLGGKTPGIFMQNSGLFLSSSDITSLLIASNMPVPIVVSWRGVAGETATQHLVNGKATVPLLEAMGIPFVTESRQRNLKKLLEDMSVYQLPAVILQKRIKFNTNPCYYRPNFEMREGGKEEVEEGNPILNREEAIDIIMEIFNKDPTPKAFFSSTGLISRSIYERYDNPNHFYNAGGFGITSSIALGFALTRPDIESIVIEGDGSVLANLGNLNLIGYYMPSRFVHIVLDNGSLVSCSGEPSIGSSEITKIAKVLGYEKAFSMVTPERLRSTLQNITRGWDCGPILISVKISQEGRRDFKRPLEMGKIARRFRNFFSQK